MPTQFSAPQKGKVTEILVNGKTYKIDVGADASLLSVLRDHLGLTGSKYGCGEGQCGACTVLIDGNPRHSCSVTVGAVGKRPVLTIESLEQNGRLHPLQQAFLDQNAMQCAYCTSGMIMTAISLLKTYSSPTDAQIAEFMQGNICRCGTYPRIEAAIKQAAAMMKPSAVKGAA
jgi:nicotinate dehydrogenase subunit A